MTDMTDWRLQGQERFLKGVSLARQTYRKHREGWDHDHCEFCAAKFSESRNDLNVGYATTDCYHWICDNCYEDFKEIFQWTVVDGPCGPRRQA